MNSMELFTKILWFAAAFATGEIFALLIFYFIRKKFETVKTKPIRSILKGSLERFAILLGLASNLPVIIIFFSAIKLGTRIKEQQESKVSNDYFLVGNIVSIIIAIAEYLIYLKSGANS